MKLIPPGATSAERNFLLRWIAQNGHDLVFQHRPLEKRKYAFDFAHLASRTAIEVDGGIWRGTKGAHGGRGAIRDRVKDLEVAMAGWHVVRVAPEMLRGSVGWKTIANIKQLIEMRAQQSFEWRMSHEAEQ